MSAHDLPFKEACTRRPIASAPRGFRLVQRTVVLPVDLAGRRALREVATSWELKRRAGFEVPDDGPYVGQEGAVIGRWGPGRAHEPFRVVWADDTGFGYRTRPGHPIAGEESFVLADERADAVSFTVRSLSRAGSARWALAMPVVRVAQRQFVNRYLAVARAAASQA